MTKLKHYSKLGIYANSTKTLTFNPSTQRAYSYTWYCLLARIDGNLILNTYRYSPTTSTHLHVLRKLLADLGIVVDYELSFPRGIDVTKSLFELVATGKEAA